LLDDRQRRARGLRAALLGDPLDGTPQLLARRKNRAHDSLLEGASLPQPCHKRQNVRGRRWIMMWIELASWVAAGLLVAWVHLRRRAQEPLRRSPFYVAAVLAASMGGLTVQLPHVPQLFIGSYALMPLFAAIPCGWLGTRFVELDPTQRRPRAS